MKQIILTKGFKAQVDDEDFEYLSQWKWLACYNTRWKNYFAARRSKHKGPLVLMHRLVTSCPKNSVVDHRDHNTLNNQKSNLRVCSVKQNRHNSKPVVGSSSKFIGVTLKKYNGIAKYWAAQMMINGRNKSLGVFPLTPEGEIQAAKARDSAALEHHGEFAYLNFQGFET